MVDGIKVEGYERLVGLAESENIVVNHLVVHRQLIFKPNHGRRVPMF